jgi:hypothetical protein
MMPLGARQWLPHSGQRRAPGPRRLKAPRAARRGCQVALRRTLQRRSFHLWMICGTAHVRQSSHVALCRCNHGAGGTSPIAPIASGGAFLFERAAMTTGMCDVHFDLPWSLIGRGVDDQRIDARWPHFSGDALDGRDESPAMTNSNMLRNCGKPVRHPPPRVSPLSNSSPNIVCGLRRLDAK